MREHFFHDFLHHETALRKFHQGRSHNAAKMAKLKRQSLGLPYHVVPKHVLFLCFKHKKNSRWEQLTSQPTLLKKCFINITLSTCENFNIRNYHSNMSSMKTTSENKGLGRMTLKNLNTLEWSMYLSHLTGGYVVLHLGSHVTED